MNHKDVMNVAFLSLGGNLGDRLAVMAAATNAIGLKCGKILKTSSVYETDAWGSGSEKKYLNLVVKIQTRLTSGELLKATRLIEKQAGRKRGKHQYKDRTLDIDILFFNKQVIQTSEVEIPHPRLHLRRFVLKPLYEIEKTLVHPVLKKNIKTLLKELNDPLSVLLYKEARTGLYICIEGNIGSGKSTLARALHKKWSSDFLPEIFEENHLLPLFYADPEPYAFSVEYGFLMNRFQQITNRFSDPEKKQLILSDYSFYKCLWYSKVNLPKNEYRLFKKQFKTLSVLLPEPDLVVYLDTSISNLRKNIKKRGRSYEKKMKSSYLESLESVYKKGLGELKQITQLFIPVKKYHPGLEEELTGIIENYIKENFGVKLKKPTFDLPK